LVGLITDGPDPLPVGAHLLAEDGQRRSLGFVTSSHVSPTLNRPIALALLEAGQNRMGERLMAFHLGMEQPVRVAPACALDPEGGRLNG
jgi:sarcosine oxidase subunit alpha